jgi:lipopolysaccharide biosynthesis protein
MTDTIRAIAFYLPQFHPIPENDAWWGKGFTEWTNVAKARPLFPGHDQPRVPADLGFYDLRLPTVRAAQAALARQYGIHGFCYWHYWFNGRRLLEMPVREVLSTGQPDFPFCLAWANENWTRTWGGENHQVLMSQVYSPEDDVEHIRWLLTAFRDPRYITIGGKPLVLIYRVNHLPDAAGTARRWREEVAKAGFPGLYLCTTTSLAQNDFDPQTIGFDAAVEFQPNWGKLPEPEPAQRNTVIGKLYKPLAPQGREAYWSNRVFSYPKVVDAMMALPEPAYRRFPGVTPRWDNSPRRKAEAIIMKDSDPTVYGRWLRHAARQSVRRFEGDERLVFINAWNEWAEGNYLEPDLQWGHRYLEETLLALEDAATSDGSR